MALHKDFPQSPHAILDPDIRWFPADEALRESSMEKLMPPLVAELRRKVKGGVRGRGGHQPEPTQLVVQDAAPAAEGLSPLALWERGRG